MAADRTEAGSDRLRGRIDVYDGLDQIGTLFEQDLIFRVEDADGAALGSFLHRDAAISAIIAHHRARKPLDPDRHRGIGGHIGNSAPTVVTKHQRPSSLPKVTKSDRPAVK